VAFQLHDTYGFPLDVTAEIVEGRGRTLDRAGFDEAMAEQRQRARAAGKKGSLAAGDEADAFAAILDEHGTTEFVGREVLDVDARIVAVVPGEGGTVSVFLDRTPFYAESGGQVGDTGAMSGEGFVGTVTDTTYAVPGVVRHVVSVSEGAPVAGMTVRAAIDVERRDAIRRNHTATHLYHWALREVLGTHVKQQG
ncbi:MAG: alanine--tRNA ligase, partial [Planctomycetes bacterium]|nr:alanine--tRNA ligase [Planctomycetota bacterium]